MNKNEKLGIVKHLFPIIGIFLLSTLAGCSTVYYFTNGQHSNELAANRYKISEKDLTRFFSTLKPYRGDPDSLYQLACYLQKRKKNKLALKVLEDVVLADPTYVKAHNAMGVSYDNLRDFPRAIEAYERALKLNPNLAYVQNNLGYSFFLQGDVDSAIEAFKTAITLDDQNERYHNNLGLAYAKKGLYEQALSKFMADGDEARAHYKMAQVLNQMNQYDMAEAHFSISSILDPKFQRTKIGSSAAYAQVESTKIDERKKAYDKSRKTPHKVEIDQKGKKNLKFKINAKSFRAAEDEKSKADFSKLKEVRKVKDLKIDIEKQVLPSEFAVEVSNGNGVNRMAWRVGNYLRKKGIKVARLTNASHFNFDETKIYYHFDHLQDAYKTAQAIPGYQNMEKLRTLSQERIKVKVLIGRDLIPHDNFFTKQLRHQKIRNKYKKL